MPGLFFDRFAAFRSRATLACDEMPNWGDKRPRFGSTALTLHEIMHAVVACALCSHPLRESAIPRGARLYLDPPPERYSLPSPGQKPGLFFRVAVNKNLRAHQARPAH